MSDSRPIDRWNRALGEELLSLSERDSLRILSRRSGIDFSSNDYLSLNEYGIIDSIIRETVASDERLRGGTGSRLIRGHDEQFETAEEAFAQYTGGEAALLFSSGYAANTGTIPALISRDDTVFSDRLCHASLIDGIRLSGARRNSFEHNDLDDLESRLKSHADRSTSPAWIVTETLFSMDGDSPDLIALADLAERYGALVYLDSAHSIGLFGTKGAGEIRMANLNERIAVSVYPMGKAPGFAGAFVCGGRNLKETLINRARSFLYSTAPPPLFATVLRRIIQYLPTDDASKRRERVFTNAKRLRAGLNRIGVDTGSSHAQIVPVILGDDRRAKETQTALIRRGFDIRAIRPPTVPEKTSRLRICVQAERKPEEIDSLVDGLKDCLYL
jgi:8-amino-7-oxononanoate synthase